MTERRYGRFFVSSLFFKDAPNGANLFNGMVVLQASPNYAEDCTEYIAAHPQFRPVRQGELIPTYEALFNAGEIFPVWRERR